MAKENGLTYLTKETKTSKITITALVHIATRAINPVSHDQKNDSENCQLLLRLYLNDNRKTNDKN